MVGGQNVCNLKAKYEANNLRAHEFFAYLEVGHDTCHKKREKCNSLIF